jgi:hypothetical protein
VHLVEFFEMLITYDKLRTFVIGPSGLVKFRESFQAGR